MNLHEALLQGIYAYGTLPRIASHSDTHLQSLVLITSLTLLSPLAGFDKPSAIQQRGIVPFVKGHDVIQQAQSGTGRTTFCAGILQNLDYSVLECQALVLAPTRELAQQIEKVVRALGDYLHVESHACVGGTSVREHTRILQGGVHVVVGTPGRVSDMFRRQALRADHIKMFVLDDADEMLSRGFKDQIHDILQLLPSKLQVRSQAGHCQHNHQHSAKAWEGLIFLLVPNPLLSSSCVQRASGTFDLGTCGASHASVSLTMI